MSRCHVFTFASSDFPSLLINKLINIVKERKPFGVRVSNLKRGKKTKCRIS